MWRVIAGGAAFLGASLAFELLYLDKFDRQIMTRICTCDDRKKAAPPAMTRHIESTSRCLFSGMPPAATLELAECSLMPLREIGQ